MRDPRTSDAGFAKAGKAFADSPGRTARLLASAIPTLLAGLLGSGCASDGSTAEPARTEPPAVTNAPRATGAWEAMEWRKLAWRSEAGPARPADRLRADAALRASVVVRRAQPGDAGAASPATGGLEAGAWTFRGPVDVGGRTRAILVDPNDPDRLLAGSVSGGLFESLDAGASWSPVADQLPNLAVGSLARSPGNPDVLYLGTGEGQFNADAIQGAGIYKSTDGGAHWALLPGTAQFESVNRIAISRQSPSLLLIATRYGGVLRSANGGSTWSVVRGAQGSYDVEFDPDDDHNAVAHLIDYDTNEWFHQVVYSSDRGLTWHSAAAPLDRVVGFNSRIELAYARSNPSIVYASVGDGTATQGIWRSTNGGQSFVRRSTNLSFAPGSWYYNALWVDPTNSGRLVVGGFHLWRSTDGGQDFTQISNGYLLTEQAHPDQHWLVEDPGYDGVANRRVWVGNDGGVFVTEDILSASTTSGWSSRNAGYTTTQYYSGKSSSSDLVQGGLQDNGTIALAAGGGEAHLTFGGDGTSTEIDNRHDVTYGSYINLNYLFRSPGGVVPDFIGDSLDEEGLANFIPPFVLDPSHLDRLYAGARSLWVADDARTGDPPTWRAIRPPGSSNLSVIAVAPSDSDIVWVAQNDAKVYRTTNATAPTPAWTAIDDNVAADPLPERYPTRIVLDWADPDSAWIALGGFTAGNVLRTSDGGASWSNASGAGATALPPAPVRGLVQHPELRSWLYAGTEVGIYVSTNGGASWSVDDEGPLNVSIDELSFAPGTGVLLAATHGRGIWTTDLAARLIFADGLEGGGVERWSGSSEAGPSCGHPLCLEGTPRVATCDRCTSQVCAADPLCCSLDWDASCVAQVFAVCGVRCPE